MFRTGLGDELNQNADRRHSGSGTGTCDAMPCVVAIHTCKNKAERGAHYFIILLVAHALLLLSPTGRTPSVFGNAHADRIHIGEFSLNLDLCLSVHVLFSP